MAALLPLDLSAVETFPNTSIITPIAALRKRTCITTHVMRGVTERMLNLKNSRICQLKILQRKIMI
jgi:hypothetical protein